MNKITLTRPDDWHCHLRDGDLLTRTVADTAKRFQRAAIMPNLQPPVTTLVEALDYQQRIIKNIPAGMHFNPLMTLYFTDALTSATIKEAKASDKILGIKLYPKGATTHSQAGVAQFKTIYPLLEVMQEVDLPLLIHGEVTDPNIDCFDREAVFIDKVLIPLHKTFPNLRMVLEHISTQPAVEFIKDTPANIAATITPQHLLYNRNALFQGGLRPHHYCLPILKRANDQEALIQAATSGHAHFFLGTDSAPHAKQAKEKDGGCAGIYSAHAAIELYAEIFAKHDALAQLEKFASNNGAEFYKLPINKQKITLIKQPWSVPKTLPFGQQSLVPLRANETVEWQIVDE